MPAATIADLVKRTGQAADSQQAARQAAAATAVQVASANGKPVRSPGANTPTTAGTSGPQ